MTVKKYNPWNSYSLQKKLFVLAIYYLPSFMVIISVMHYLGMAPHWRIIIGGALSVIGITIFDALYPHSSSALRIALAVSLGVLGSSVIQVLFS